MKKIFFLFAIVVFFVFINKTEAQQILLNTGDSISVSLEDVLLNEKALLEIYPSMERNWTEKVDYIYLSFIQICPGVEMKIKVLMLGDELQKIDFFWVQVDPEIFSETKKVFVAGKIYSMPRSIYQTKEDPIFKSQVEELVNLLKKSSESWSMKIQDDRGEYKNYYGKFQERK
ncbi:MAG TPA: hypothetical protein PLO44_01370 [Candidatus Paceibacterota bacterium]|nr:hypothetical protein [Candidatus Paceibacterota bacterium]